MSDFSERIARLSPEALAELERRLHEADSSAESQPIRRRAGEGPVPLSFAQQRLWFLDRLDPGKSHFNIPEAVRIRGALDVTALSRALETIRERHEVLRSVFTSARLPVQVISMPHEPFAPRISSSGAPEGAGTRASRDAALEAGAGPFDLERGPLLRTLLLRLKDDVHFLLFTAHHIVFDGWSRDIFFSELASLYEAYRAGRSSPLPELPIQYADYAVWQREWLRGEVLDTQLAYWKKQLDGIPALLELPTDRPRSMALSGRGATLAATLPSEILQGLSALALREGATLFMTLLAAFQALLSRYTGQEDIPVGFPIAGRTQVETEGLIGFFVNTLILRGDLSGDPTFRQLLVRTRDTALEAYAHQDLPFEKLVEEIQPARTLNHSPLFQVLFQLFSESQGGQQEAAFPDLKVEKYGVQWDTAKFDLSLGVAAGADRLSCVFEYKTELFDAETIQRMLEHWRRLLAGIVADPDRRLSEIPLLSEGERRRVMVDWNATASPYPREESVAQVFEKQAASRPGAVALVSGDERLSYGELNSRANRLARFLRSRGLAREAPVGVCLERSTDMIVALLAILKAGCAYVPLDPSYPRDRIAFLLRDTGMPLLLTEQSVIDKLPATCLRLRLDAERAEIDRQSDENLPAAASGDSLAYVMYTSGSTGAPKGVAVPHRGIVRLVTGIDYVRIDSTTSFCSSPRFPSTPRLSRSGARS